MRHTRYQSIFPIIIVGILIVIGIASDEPAFVLVAVPIAIYTIYRWQLFEKKMKQQIVSDNVDRKHAGEKSEVDTYLSNAEKINLLIELRDKGEITEDEFRDQKEKIIATSKQKVSPSKSITMDKD